MTTDKPDLLALAQRAKELAASLHGRQSEYVENHLAIPADYEAIEAAKVLTALAEGVVELTLEIATLRTNRDAMAHGEKVALEMMAAERKRAEAAEVRESAHILSLVDAERESATLRKDLERSVGQTLELLKQRAEFQRLGHAACERAENAEAERDGLRVQLEQADAVIADDDKLARDGVGALPRDVYPRLRAQATERHAARERAALTPSPEETKARSA